MKSAGCASLGVGIGTALVGSFCLIAGDAVSGVSRILVGCSMVGFGAAMLGMVSLKGGDKDAKNW